MAKKAKKVKAPAAKSGKKTKGGKAKSCSKR